MEHLHSYKDSFYYHLEGYEEDSSPHCDREAAANVGGSVYEGALSLDDSENQQGNVNQGGHMSPYNSLGPEGDHSNQVPMEEDPEEPDILLPEVPRRQPRRHQIQFHFTEWQVQEMETIFQETQYPDVLTRLVMYLLNVLATPLGRGLYQCSFQTFSYTVVVFVNFFFVCGMKVLQAEEGRNEKESGQCEPGWRTAAAEGEREKELSGESHTAAGAVGLIDDNMNKEGGGAGGYQESEQQPKEPIPGGVEGERVQSVPRQVPSLPLRHRFTRWQPEELELI
ncbi:hypothetical protein STEG23_032149 [Scotinomys teguina]